MRFRADQPANNSDGRGSLPARTAGNDGISDSTLPLGNVPPLPVSSAEDHLSKSAIVAPFVKDVLAAVAEQCAAPVAFLWRYKERQHALCLEASHRRGGAAQEKEESHPWCRPGQTLKTGLVWEKLRSRGLPITLDATEEMCRSFRKLLTLARLRRLVLLPLKDEEATIGAVGVAFAGSNTGEPAKIEIARLLSQQIAAGWKLADLLDQKLQSVILEERRRISRDLHDTLAQSFTSILMQMDVFEEALLKAGQQMQQQIARVRRLAQDGLIDVRRAIFGLQPQSLENCCLVQALERLTDKFNIAGGSVQAEFSQKGSIAAVAVGTQDHLLRIAQESLANIFKHADATNVKINLTVYDRSLRLTICDDGAGFKFSKRGIRGGFGLKSMEERVTLIGGRLSVSSRPGAGTQVQVTAPLDASRGAKTGVGRYGSGRKKV